MPAFMFEKISVPAPASLPAVKLKEPRGVIIQMLDRLTESRLQRVARRARLDAGYTEADITPHRMKRE